eukprot:12127037-Ditylum_brightwellii.AAC.1
MELRPSVTKNFNIKRVIPFVDNTVLLVPSEGNLDPWQKGFAMEGESAIAIRIQIHIVYVQNMCQ